MILICIKQQKFTITDTKIYVSKSNLCSTQDDAKLNHDLLHNLRTINWNKYQSKITTQVVSWYLDYLIDHTFQASNRLLVLLFENFNDRTVHIEYFLTTVDIKE